MSLQGKKGLIIGIANHGAAGRTSHDTETFYGSKKVAEDYNLMEPVKAALGCSVRCVAAELDRGASACTLAGTTQNPRRLRHRAFR